MSGLYYYQYYFGKCWKILWVVHGRVEFGKDVMALPSDTLGISLNLYGKFHRCMDKCIYFICSIYTQPSLPRQAQGG